MKTIEMYEAEIGSKFDRCKDQLAIFHSNIGKIGNVIGKDSTVVYTTLSNSLNALIADYNILLPRNAATMQPMSDKADRILSILAPIMDAIDQIDNAPGENQLSTKTKIENIMEGVNQYVEDMSKKISVQVQQGSGQGVSSNLIKYGIYGVGSYLILNKLIGLSPFLSAAGAVGVVYLVDGANK